jgi:acetyl-CoA carboxylase carboxyltransferase component
VPAEGRRVYDVRDVVRCLVDGGELLEVAANWARSIVTGFARIDGRPVGVIANQPRYLGGVLDADSSQKGARSGSRSWCWSTRLGTCPGAARSRPA